MNAAPPSPPRPKRHMRLIRSCPEYALFESDEARARAVAELDSDLERNKRYWAQVFILAALVGGACIVINALLGEQPWFPQWARIATVFTANVLLFGLILVHWRRSIIARLRGKLIEQGVPVCRACGYPMRGLPLPRCPECGWQADDAVRALLTEAGKAPAE